MNETLKAAGNLGAELGAAKADLQRELERHRKTWRQLEQVTGLLKMISARGLSPVLTEDELERIDAAISQQAEPAPAQDEREAPEVFAYRWKSSIHTVPNLTADRPPSDSIHGYDYILPLMTVAQHERIVAALTRPAQTEQQPVEQWQVRYLPGQKVEERWWQDSTAERAAWCAEANAEQLAKGLPDVWEIRKFYAAPIAQAEQHPVRLPARKPDFPSSDATGEDWENSGWNDALDEVARLNAAPIAQTAPLDADTLAEIIRKVDGNHSLGAGVLAERIVAELSSTPSPTKRGDA